MILQISAKYDIILCFIYFDIINTKIDDNIQWRVCKALQHVIFEYIKITRRKKFTSLRA